ncbi:capsid assembly scaffolding protein Gp46 family protein, partial [Acidaminococcus sp. HCP3S3_H5]
VASAALAATGLPASFADYVIGDSPEATKHNVNSLDVEINNLLSQRVEEKVKGLAAQTAPSNQDIVGVGGQREAKSLFDLSPQEAMQLKASNPAKYEALRRNS